MKRLNREVRKRLSFLLAAVMLVLSVPQTALSVEAKTGENTGIVSEMTVKSEKKEEGTGSDEVSEGTEETPESGEGSEGTEGTPGSDGTSEGAEDSEETPESDETSEDAEETPETGEGTEGSEETSDSGETSEGSEDSKETPETDENAESVSEETEIVKAAEEVSEAATDADTFEVDYIIYEVISEQDHTVRVKGMNRDDFNKHFFNIGGPVELTIPAAVESEEVTWQVTEIGKFALADYQYEEYNLPGNAYGADMAIGSDFGYNLYISKVIVSPGITRIEKGAFYRTFQIDEIVLPDTVVEIGEAAFYFDEELRYGYGDDGNSWKSLKVNIPTAIKTISAYAYHGVFFENTLKIPNGVEVIKEYAFACESDASGIYTAEIPSSVKKIERYAFDNTALINAVLYQPNSPFPAVLDGSAEIEYSSWTFGESDKELTLFVPESLMESYRFRLIAKLPNLQIRNINDYKEIKESPLRFLYDGSEFDLLTIPVSEPGLPEDIRSVTIDMGEADFRLDDIQWVFTVYGSEEKVTEEELKKYLRYEVKADGTMSFVGADVEGSWYFTVTAKVDGYLPASFNIYVTDGGPNKKFLDRVKALTAEDIAEMKKISYSPEIAFQLEEIRAMAEEITAGCTCDRDKILAVHTWLADYIAYDYDAFYFHEEPLYMPYAACPYLPYEVLKNRYTVCGGYAGLAEDMLRSIGIPCAYVDGWVSGSCTCGTVYGGESSDHAWNMAYDGSEGRWIYFDATWDGVGDVNDNSISSMDVSAGRGLGWFDFDAEKEMKRGREFRDADFCERRASYGSLTECSYMTLFPGEEGKFQALQGYHDVAFRLDDGFADTDGIELDAEGNVRALKPGTVKVCIEGRDADGYAFTEYGDVRVLKKESFAFERTEIRVGTEDEYKVYCLLNKEYVNWFVEMTSDHPDVVTVRKDGTLEPKKAGTAVITARLIYTAAEDKPETSCRVTVVEGKTIVDDGRFIYHILSESSGSDPGTVELIGHLLGKLDEDWSNWLTKLEIPDLVTLGGKSYAVIGIGKKAFFPTYETDDVVTRIKEVVLPDTLQYIEEYAFSRRRLTVNFPASLQRIEKGAFSMTLSCDVVFPEGSQLSYIGDEAFRGNGNMTKLDLSNCSRLREIGEGAFADCDGRSYPEKIPGLSEVKLPEGLKIIGANAFHYDNMVTSVRIPSTVESIGDYAFSQTGLTGAVDISGATTLGEGLFSNSGIETVILSDALREIPKGVFRLTETLNNVLPKSYLEELGGMEDVSGGIFKLPKSVRSIGDYAFEYTGLTGTIDISGVSELGRGVFCGSKEIETIILPDGLDEIPEAFFSGMHNLKNVVSRSRLGEWNAIRPEEGAVLLSDQITKIGARAFEVCIIIRSVEAPGVKELGAEVFDSCKKLKDVTLSDELTVIPDKAFAFCDVLDSYPLGDHIETIGEQAFYFCEQLGSSTGGAIELGRGLKSIGKWAFGYCTSVKKVTIYSKVIESIGEDCFSTNPVLYVYKLPSGIYESALGDCVSEIIYLESESVLAQSVAIEPDQVALAVGETKQLVCTVLPENTENPAVTWASTDPNVVTVDNGLITAKASGKANVMAVTMDGTDLKAFCYVAVSGGGSGDDSDDPNDEEEGSINIANLQYVSIPNQTYTGRGINRLPGGAEDTGILTVTDKASGKEITLWQNIDYIAVYRNNVNAGTANVTLVGVGRCTGSKKLTYKILPRDLQGVEGEYVPANITLAAAAVDYTGKAVTPSVSVTSRIGDANRTNTLVQGKDFTVKYANNTKSSEGASKKPTVTITGKGNYKGKLTAVFEINKTDIAGDAIAVTPIADQKRGAKNPVPVLTYNGKKLKNKSDFTVSYIPHINAETGEGTVDVLISGQNNFCGERTESFRVMGALIGDKNVKIQVSNVVYTGNSETSKPQITVTRKIGTETVELKEGDHYEVVYDSNPNVTKKKSVTIKGIGSFDDAGSFGGRKTVTYKMTAKSINSEAEGQQDIACALPYEGKAFFYTGNAVKAKVVLTDRTITENGAPKVLVENVDYTLKYARNKEATTSKAAVITIVGKGNYKDTFSVKPEFQIIPWNLRDELKKDTGEAALIIDDVKYAGKALKPAVVISVKQPDGTEHILKNSAAYKVTYSNNKNAAKKDAGALAPTAIVTPNRKKGMAQSTDETITCTFTIEPLDLAESVIKAVPDQTYKGKPVTPTPSVKLGRLTLQAKKGDIVFGYSNHDKRGIATLTITPGSGNYVGQNSTTYLIK